MTTSTWAYTVLLLAIVSEVVATCALKLSNGMTRPAPSVTVVIGYAICFYLLALSLKNLPVSLVYGIWAGLGIVGVTIVGAILFGESITVPKLLGIALIVLGIVVLEISAGMG